MGTLRERMFLAPASLFSRHGSYSEAFVRKDEENISLLYRSSGFRDVKVTSSIERDYRGKPGDLALTLRIDEGRQWLVDHLEISGAASEHLPELQKLIISAAGEPFSDVALSTDRENILTYYYSHGYPAASFTASLRPDEAPTA
jgi:outer membrane protein assembly factor BamA